MDAILSPIARTVFSGSEPSQMELPTAGTSNWCKADRLGGINAVVEWRGNVIEGIKEKNDLVEKLYSLKKCLDWLQVHGKRTSQAMN